MSNEPLDKPIRLLQYQIQQRLDQDLNRARSREVDWPFEVLMRPALTINSGPILRPALCVIEHLPVTNAVISSAANVEAGPIPMIHWILDIETDNSRQLSYGVERGIVCSQVQSKTQCTKPDRPLAIADGCDYWCLRTASVELLIRALMVGGLRSPSKLLQRGERAIATALPGLALCLQEPLPLYFLTRTLAGQRTYIHTPLPLQVCDWPV